MLAAQPPSNEALPKPSGSSRWKRLLNGDEEQTSDASVQPDVQLAQAQTGAVDSKGMAPIPSQTDGQQAEPHVAPASTPASNAESAKSATGSRMPDFMNDMVGGMPLGAVMVSGGLLAYGLAGGGNANGSSNDTRAPVLQSAATSADGKTIVLSYDETLGTTSLPAAGAFSVTSDGAAVAVSSVARGADGKTMVLTLATGITGLKTALVSYIAPAAPAAGTPDLTLAIRDLSGNHAASFIAQAVTVVDTTGPTVVSSRAYTTADASVVVLTYSEALLASAAPAASTFTVTLDGSLNPVSAVTIVGTEVRLTLQNKLSNGTGSANVLTVAYTAPAADTGTSNAALQDLTGNDAASIVTPRPISNHVFDTLAPTLSTASINAAGTEVTLTFSEALDAMQTVSAAAFAVQVAEGGSTHSVGVSAVRVSGSQMILTLSERVQTATGGIQVSYTDPTTGNDANALQDLAGNDAATLAHGVVNNVDTTAPVVSLASFKDSKTLVLTYLEDLAPVTASAAAFSVVSAGAANAVTAVKVSGKTLELTLSNAVTTGDATNWSYAAPTADRTATNAAVQDLVGNDMVSATNQTVDTTRATWQSANTGTAGNLLVLNFNEALLNTNLPAATTFQVLGSQSGLHTVSSLSVSGSEVSLTLSAPLLRNETVSWSYTAPADNIATTNAALQDFAGNDVISLGTPQPLSATNKVAPLLTGKALAMNASSALNALVLSFDDALSASPIPAASAFSVVVNGTPQTPSGVHIAGNAVTLDLAALPTSSATVSSLPITVSYVSPTSNPLHDIAGNAVVSFSGVTVATLRLGTSGDDAAIIGGTGVDYFSASLGNDVMTGGGGADVVVFSNLASTGTAPKTTLKDFGLKSGTGSLQGSAEADLLDLSHLLVGYSSATRGQFLQFSKDSGGKLVMSMDQDGGGTFAATASVVFDNITVNAASNHLVVNGVDTAHIYTNDLSVSNNVLDQLLLDAQLRLV